MRSNVYVAVWCPSLRPSVRLSVCSIDRTQQWRAAGLLLGGQLARDRPVIDSGGRRAPSSNGAAAANAGSVTFTATVAG